MFYGFGQMVATPSGNSSSLASSTTGTQQMLQQQITTNHQIASTTTTSIPTNTNISRPSGPSSIESAPPPTPTIAAPAPPAPPKRRQIYRFTSSRPLFAAGWSSKTDSEGRWRIAVGSVVEDKPHNNRVSVIQLDEQQGELVERLSFEHTFPPNCIQWIPDMMDSYPDLLATSAECLKIYRVEPNSVMMECILNNKQASNYSGPLTNFDWNDIDPTLIGTSSIDMSCTIWQLEVSTLKKNRIILTQFRNKCLIRLYFMFGTNACMGSLKTGQALAQTKKTNGSVKTQLIAHDKPVHDIKFSRINRGRDNFATVGADGSARLFDLRNLQHSTIVYEDPLRSPLMRLAWNKQESHYLATFAQDSAEVVIVDIRVPCNPLARLHNHRACVNGIAWAPHSSCHICTAGDDRQALIWDISPMPRPVEDPILAYQAEGEVNQVHWIAANRDCLGLGVKLMAITQHLSHVMQQLMSNEITQVGSSQPSGVSNSNSKYKEVYKYEAPHALYSTGWSQHPDPAKKFRLALASFIEEYNNKAWVFWFSNKNPNSKYKEIYKYEDRIHCIQRIQLISIVKLDEDIGEFVDYGSFDHPYPATKVMWIPDQKGIYPDLIATTGDYLRLWRVGGADGAQIEVFLNNNRSSEYCAPLTSFDWNDVDVGLIGTSSIDTTCTIWQVETGQAISVARSTEGTVKTQLIAHDKEVFDIAFTRMASGREIFASVGIFSGADGSLRMFDLRHLEHSTIMFEEPSHAPLLRLECNKQDCNYIATFVQDSAEVIILDVRIPCTPVAKLDNHRGRVNGMAWAPHSSCHICTAGGDSQALIWDIHTMPRPVDDPILAYQANGEINQVHWAAAFPDWISICYKNMLEILRV
ncbi:unnamed protein product [Wuchereria bancrofti]|uniref:WD_REPEATS_REGION domain-containing protein n=2 Tax=Wuchereria bancrofti TaxID=6293 RepID=A0A3P7ET90_WUCBA|nr:unnamed protein product [Wuchereria bancrofti]